MKIRTDFVTNSSSSSFILVFRDDAELQDFHEWCRADLDGDRVRSLIERCMQDNADGTAKERALQMLRWQYEYEERRRLCSEKIVNCQSFRDRLDIEDAYIQSEECQKAIAQYLDSTDYAEKRQRLESAKYVSEGKIWDTNGGLLEWAIRHDYLQDELWPYLLTIWHVG